MPVEHRPPPGLETFVACAWIGTTTGASVLPDGCVDVVWSAEQVVVAGPATRPADVPAVEGDARLGVRFRVGLAGPALGVPARALRDEEVPLGELWGAAEEARLRAAVARGWAGGEQAALGALLGAIARRLPPAPDPLVRRAVLGVAGGVEELARDAALSERQLRRRFDDAVGFGPRTLRRVLRLQHFLRLAERAPGATLARLAADAGFADQAHLARDCRDLAGAPPSVLLGRGARAAGEPQTSGTSKAPLAAPAILGA